VCNKNSAKRRKKHRKGQESGREDQDFFDGGVGDQALEPVLRAPGAFQLMLGTVRGHALG
jgi:hypothetical protein